MARLWTNSIRGELSSGVTDTDTTLDAAIFAELPAVSAPDTLRLTLDPGRDEGLGKPEIVEVTAHSASSTSVTVTREVETGNNGGAAQAWPAGTTVVHALTAAWEDAGGSAMVETGSYTGDGSTDRTIPTALTSLDIVFVKETGDSFDQMWISGGQSGSSGGNGEAGANLQNGSSPTVDGGFASTQVAREAGGGGFIVDAPDGGNKSGVAYAYTAIGT